MTNIIPKVEDNNVSKVERFSSLSAGQFWRSLDGQVNDSVLQDQILLLDKVDFVEGHVHTIHVRLHPSMQNEQSNHTARFLFDDFMNAFEHVDDETAETDRQLSMSLISAEMAHAQVELQQASSGTATLDEFIARDKLAQPNNDGAPAQLPIVQGILPDGVSKAIQSQSVAALMSPELSESGVESIKQAMMTQQDVVAGRSDWLQAQTQKFSTIATKLTPYIIEKSAAAIALAGSMKDKISELMKGIDSLNLYTLKNVEVETIKTGVSAAKTAPLSVLQTILFMDEELSLFEPVENSFDCNNRSQFFEALKNHPNLVEQIFSGDRCIVGVAATRRDIYHNDSHRNHRSSHADAKIENKKVFLLVKDGENIHVVLSPELGHNRATCLFPSTDQLDAQFKGVDGQEVTYNDVNYVSCKNQFDAMALTYKRLLILLCGLDHKKQLFGDFYGAPASLDFVSLDFQERHFNFIHDQDGTGLISTSRPADFKEWLLENNAHITSGSRVLFDWNAVFTYENIPSAHEKMTMHHRDTAELSLEYEPVFNSDTIFGENKRFIQGIVFKKGSKLFLSVPLSGETKKGEHREFNANLDISHVSKYCHSDFEFICLDRITPSDCEWYLHDRQSRKLNITGIRLLKAILKNVKEERKEEAPIRDELLSALLDGRIADEAKAGELIDKAVSAWRCASRGKPLTSITGNKAKINKLLDQLYELANDNGDVISQIQALELARGRTVIRIGLTKSGQYASYSTPLHTEIDDRLFNFSWVVRTRYIKSTDAPKAQPSTFVKLQESNAAEHLAFELDDISDYINIKCAFKTPAQKAKILSNENQNTHLINTVKNVVNDAEAWHELVAEYCAARKNASHGHVNEVNICVPIGISSYDDQLATACLSGSAIKVLISTAPDGELGELKKAYLRIYKVHDANAKVFDNLVSNVGDKSLFECLSVSMLVGKTSVKGIFSTDDVTYLDAVDGFDYSLQASIDEPKHPYRAIFNCKTILFDDIGVSIDTYLGIHPKEDYAPVIRAEFSFNSKRGYDLYPYTPVFLALLQKNREYDQLDVFDSEVDALKRANFNSEVEYSDDEITTTAFGLEKDVVVLDRMYEEALQSTWSKVIANVVTTKR